MRRTGNDAMAGGAGVEQIHFTDSPATVLGVADVNAIIAGSGFVQ